MSVRAADRRRSNLCHLLSLRAAGGGEAISCKGGMHAFEVGDCFGGVRPRAMTQGGVRPRAMTLRGAAPPRNDKGWRAPLRSYADLERLINARCLQPPDLGPLSCQRCPMLATIKADKETAAILSYIAAVKDNMRLSRV